MRALYKTPENTSFRQIIVPNQLHVLQDLVGGYIETWTFAADACVICNEEGIPLGLPYNCRWCGQTFAGPILIVGIDGEEFTDCPMSVVMANGGIEK